MTITQRRLRGGVEQPGEPGSGERFGSRPADVRLRARRSPRLIAVGILLACLGGLGGAALLSSSTHTSSVVVMARSVARGDTVRATDLGVVTIGPVPGVLTIPSAQLSQLVGRSARVDLPEGSLPGPAAIGELTVPADYSQLGLKLEAGHVPVSDLPPGTAVRLVPVSATASDPAPDGNPISAVVVTSPQSSESGGSVVLDVAVRADQAVTVARLAARGQLAVVREGRQ